MEHDWQEIRFEDIPDLGVLEQYTLSFLRDGVSNSDAIRESIRQQMKVVIMPSDGKWNDSPSGKFVNQHAHVLRQLVQRRVISPIKAKEYRLLPRQD